MISPPPERIIWAYGEWQSGYTDVQGVEFVEGLPDLCVLKSDPQRKLLICDDLMQCFAKQSSDLINLFTRASHHHNMAVIHIVQNLFFTNLRTARVNSHYLVLMRNPGDKLQAHTLARQLYPGKHKYFLESYDNACSVPFGYLLADLEPHTCDDIRLRTNIFPGENCCVYVPRV